MLGRLPLVLPLQDGDCRLLILQHRLHHPKELLVQADEDGVFDAKPGEEKNKLLVEMGKRVRSACAGHGETVVKVGLKLGLTWPDHQLASLQSWVSCHNPLDSLEAQLNH